MSSVINGFEDRIVALSGVTQSSDDTSTFLLNDDLFISKMGADSLVLHMSDACFSKLDAALKSETRVSEINEKSASVSFKFNNDVDKEFVFLYIRFAWKHSRAKVDAA